MKEVTIIKPIENKSIRRNAMQFSKLRVAPYCRVSTGSEEQKNSYESQLQYYKEMVDKKDEWELVDIYADEAISGTQVYKRSDFQRMINDAMNGHIDMIITKSISRFARNTLDTLKYVRMLKEKNVSIMFEKENINTLTMNGELLLVILSSMAQQESESIAGNVKIGLKMKMSRGELVGFNKCLGYDYDKETKSISLNHKGAEIVSHIFERYINGAGAFVIAKELKELGYLNTKGTTNWTESAIRCIIKNEKYKGDLLLGKTFTVDPITHKRLSNLGESEKYYVENHHEPIVSKEIWEEAQRIRKKRFNGETGEDSRRKYSKKHAFSSLIKCADCGSTYIRRTWHSKSEREKHVWSCITRIQKGRNNCLTSISVSEEVLEKSFLEAYTLVAHNNKEIIENLIKVIDEILKADSDISIIDSKAKKRDSVKEKIGKLLDLKLENNISDEIYNEKLDKLNDELNKLESSLLELKEVEKQEQDYKSKTKRIRERFNNLNEINEFDREVFECIVEKVLVGWYNEREEFEPNKITFVFKTGDEITGNIVSTRKTKTVLDKYEEEAKKKDNCECSNAVDDLDSMCSHSEYDTERKLHDEN